ncbi:hypothetical protein CERZMDRAFT_89167 [Cercospora zeae-maydis SCOH1-5]|uniref:Uncharacterized protein n=1 Tax=Cercospora zeae-maydis SCOH1-5 TaxID=717836 RepID=A0A6A6EW73_9PEZI|nr:hypothetical protein CERZMDRAFT_89167 [Cercospora zeae-maydis SCOH1-5]
MERPIARILRKKVDGAKTMYQVRWKSTMLGRHDIHLRENGMSYALFDGIEWDIEDVTRRSGGVFEVTWTDTWQEYDDVAGAEDDMIAEFEAGFLPPEDATDYAAAEVPLSSFVPDSTADYTDSFVTKLTALSRSANGRLPRKIPIWLACLQLPTRNRLVFRKTFSDKRNTINLSQDNERREHQRILSIHRTGNAMIRPCEDCREGKGALRRCVVDRYGSALNGSCTNCGIGGRMAQCSFKVRGRSGDRKVSRGRCTPIKKDSTYRSSHRSSKPVPPSAKRAPDLEDSHPEANRLTRAAARSTSTHPATDKKNLSVSNKEVPAVSNSIGGPADWSPPNVPEEEGQSRGDPNEYVESSCEGGFGVGDKSPVSNVTPSRTPRALPAVTMGEGQHDHDRKCPSLSAQHGSRTYRSAEQARISLLARFKSSASPNKATAVDSRTDSKASVASPDTAAATDLDINTARDLLGRCCPAHVNMFSTAWATWLQERGREKKSQLFLTREHFLAVVFGEELKAGAVYEGPGRVPPWLLWLPSSSVLTKNGTGK